MQQREVVQVDAVMRGQHVIELEPQADIAAMPRQAGFDGVRRHGAAPAGS
ncbi:hypothetical protein WJ972_19280 [Achromobacter insuavis]